MRCAVVQNFDNVVVNLIMADPSVDPAPEGTILVGLPDDSPVSMGWTYDPATGQFTDPNPPVEEAIEVTPPVAEVIEASPVVEEVIEVTPPVEEAIEVTP